MKIKQVEELVGITRKNIRFYEEQELLSVGRSENGYREYGMEDVKRLKEIRLLRRLGVSLEEIRKLFDGHRSLEDVLEHQVIQLEQQKDSLHRTQLFCRQMLEDRPSLEKLDADACLEQMDKLEKEGVIFMDETHMDIHKKKQLGAVFGAVVMSILMLALIGLMVWANTQEQVPVLILVVYIGVPVLVILGVVAALVFRLKEIKGGEEDEASKY